MNIKIDGLKYEIKPLSKLSVSEYMKIIDGQRHVDLISYISALSGRDIDKANVKGIHDIGASERYLLDIDLDFVKLTPPNMYEDEIVKHLYKRNFGYKYVFDLYRNQKNADEISIVELCVYALAICLSKEDEYADVEPIHTRLMNEEWVKILPIGFFLSKKLKMKNRYLITFLMRSIVKLQSKPKRQTRVVGAHTI
jgi:hypothetical protein